MSLLELTVTISVLILIVTILFFGATAWKRGSDRASCVLAVRNVQVAARSYQNLYGYNYGGRPCAENGTQDIVRHLFDKGYIESNLYEQATGVQKCPSGGSYTCPVPDVFPQQGDLYMQCSLASVLDHEPPQHSDW
jgi:type II secretory pathway pseudopilin PulG